MAQPHIKEKIVPALLVGQAAMAQRKRGTKSPESAQRMRDSNPMNNPVTRAKMAASLMGRAFLERGGNGKLTRQQQALHDATGYPMEHVIVTAPVKGKFPSLPNCYKADLADPARMLLIEVDGKMHRLRKWKILDARRTAVLNALGWSVLRFWNQEVDQDLPKVLATIVAFTASK